MDLKDHGLRAPAKAGFLRLPRRLRASDEQPATVTFFCRRDDADRNPNLQRLA